MQRTNIYLGEDQIAALDLLAQNDGVPRAEVVRRLIDQGIAGRQSTVIDRRKAIQSAFGACPDFEVPDRSPAGHRQAHLDQLWGGNT